MSEDKQIVFSQKDGDMSLIPRNHPETMELTINATSNEIIQKCDGERTIQQILPKMQKKYPEVKDNGIEETLRRKQFVFEA